MRPPTYQIVLDGAEIVKEPSIELKKQRKRPNTAKVRSPPRWQKDLIAAERLKEKQAANMISREYFLPNTLSTSDFRDNISTKNKDSMKPTLLSEQTRQPTGAKTTEGSILNNNPFQVDVFINKIQERPLSGLQPRKRKLLVLEQDAIPNASITNINSDFDRLMSRLNSRLNTRPNMPSPFYSTQRLPLTHKQEFYSTTMPLKGSHIVPILLKSQY